MEAEQRQNNEEAMEQEQMEAGIGKEICKLNQGSTLQKVVWTAVAIGLCVGFTLHLVMLVERYQLFPVNTETEEKTDKYEFPDVTLCPMNFMSRNYSLEPKVGIPSPNNMAGAPQRGITDMIWDPPRVLYLMMDDYHNQSVPLQPYSHYRDAKLMLSKVAYRIKQFPEAHDIVIFCNFNSQGCSFRNFTIQKDENYFQCITFSPENRTVIQGGQGNGLHILFFIHSDAFSTPVEEINHKNGLKVLIHNPGEKPNLHGPQILAPVQYKTDAIIDAAVEEKLNRQSYPCVETLPNVTYVTDFGQLNSPPQNESFFGTTDDCKFRLMQEEFVRECGCLATDLPRPADLFHQVGKVCHDIHEYFLAVDVSSVAPKPDYRYYVIRYTAAYPSMYDNYMPLYEHLMQNWYWHLQNTTVANIKCYHRVRNRQKAKGVNTTSCPVLCKKKIYSVSDTKFWWPADLERTNKTLRPLFSDALNDASKENLTLVDLQQLVSNPENSIKNFMGVLDLYPRELSVRVSKEDWAYPLRNFFSDFGGILGFWIGASIVTIVEVMEMVISTFVLVWSKIQDRKRIRVQKKRMKKQQQQQHQDLPMEDY